MAGQDANQNDAPGGGAPGPDQTELQKESVVIPSDRKTASRTSPSDSYIRQLEPGVDVGRFVLKAKIGQGGMGAVFLAHDPELKRDVAIKIIKPRRLRSGGSHAQQRMLREAQAMAMVSHPNLAVIYEVGTYEKTIFLAMEYITGEALGTWLRRRPPLEDIFEVFDQAGKALSAVHDAGLIHRDFKPDNVIVTPDGTPKVLDLGIARRLSPDGRKVVSASAEQPRTVSSHTATDTIVQETVGRTSRWAKGERTSAEAKSAGNDAPDMAGLDGDAFEPALTRQGTMVGTPNYMPPEQLLGAHVTFAVDQFALAVSFYEALTAQKPYAGLTPSELLANIMAGELRPWPRHTDAPLALRLVLQRALSAHPDDRFESVEEFMNACLIDQGMRHFGRVICHVLDPADPFDMRRICGVWCPERGLIYPIAFAFDRIGEPERLKHLHRARVDAIGLTLFDGSWLGLDDHRVDFGELRKLGGKAQARRPATGNQDVHLFRYRRVWAAIPAIWRSILDVGIATAKTVYIELHGELLLPLTPDLKY